MEAFVLEIAGLRARVEPMFMSTREYLKDYLSESNPDFMITVSEADLVFEQKMMDLEADEEGMKRRIFTGPFLERATIQRRFAEALLLRDTVLMHGSTVGVDGNAYLFTAPCGTGKSTHARLWRQVFGDRAVMINDDKPFLRLIDAHVEAYGTPWCGKHGLHSNTSMPLKGICILRRGRENRITRCQDEAFLDFLLHQTLIPEDPALRTLAEALVSRLAKTVPVWEMECNKDPQAALVSYGAMSGAEIKP